MSNRIRYIDYLESVAMFCVISLHFQGLLNGNAVENAFLLFSKVFAVPIFFLANGSLLFLRPFHLNKHLKKNRHAGSSNSSMEGTVSVFQLAVNARFCMQP